MLTTDRTQVPIETIERIVPALRVLAHPVRLQLVDLLLIQQISVGELAQKVGIPSAVASQHLNTMRAHGLLKANRQGKQVFYEVVSEEAVHLIACIRGNHC